MRIAIVTPLYPPEVAEPAPYAKELATRLATEHRVTVVLYGRLPENVPGVSYRAVDKHYPLVRRVVAFTRALLQAAREHDVLYVENGASVELPTIVTRIVTRTPYVFHLGDERARSRSDHNPLRGLLTRLVQRMACATITTRPPARPEVLPFAPYPSEAFTAYEAAWNKHLVDIHAALRA